MINHKCKECQFFRQHYTFDKRRIFRVWCGHCTLVKAKQKLPDAKACENFIPGPVQENAFASKEYLSKELLPEIEDRG